MRGGDGKNYTGYDLHTQKAERIMKGCAYMYVSCITNSENAISGSFYMYMVVKGLEIHVHVYRTMQPKACAWLKLTFLPVCLCIFTYVCVYHVYEDLSLHHYAMNLG